MTQRFLYTGDVQVPGRILPGSWGRLLRLLSYICEFSFSRHNFTSHIPPFKCHTVIIFAFHESEPPPVQKFQTFIGKTISSSTNSQQVANVDLEFTQN